MRLFFGYRAVFVSHSVTMTCLDRPSPGEDMGYQVKCGSTKTTTGKPCGNPAMIGYSRCQKHRGDWTPKQKRKTKKR
jgi:hypothetical protein